MSDNFPYQLLNKSQIISKLNSLYSSGKAFVFIIDYKAEYGYVIEREELDERFIRFRIDSTKSDYTSYQPISSASQNNDPKPILNWQINPVSLNEYKSKFDYVIDEIHKGNSFLTNLTQPTELSTNLSLSEIYNTGNAKYKLWIKDKFVVLSPETFIQINGHSISSFPMKGTIDASVPDAENIILNDPKEKAEHATIVDLIRNDLSMVSRQVEVKRYRYIDRITTNTKDLLQVSSEILGRLPENYKKSFGEILFTLLPAGSISGAPKKKTLEIIAQAEAYERVFYTGVWGYFDGECLDSAVMIRFIEQIGEKLIYKSGGGITAQSDLTKEYNELIQKVYVPVI